MAREDGDDDDWEDLEAPDARDVDPEEDEPTISCPHCEADVYEGSPRCPQCGMYLSQEDAPRRLRHPWWIWLAVALALAATATWILR